MKFLARKRKTLKQTFAIWVYRWRLFQHKHSRWTLFQSLREIRGHYNLWRMRPAIMAQPRSLMVGNTQVYHYGAGTYGVEMLPIKDAPMTTYPTLPGSVDYWKSVEPHLFNKNLDDTARKLGYEILHR